MQTHLVDNKEMQILQNFFISVHLITTAFDFMFLVILRTVLFLVTTIVNCNLSETEDGKLSSILQLPGSILIIPQATLGGRLKGQRMQYHNNIDKTTGLELYTEFVEMIKQVSAADETWREKECAVKSGTYGNRQVLKIDTNGPYTHLIEF